MGPDEDLLAITEAALVDHAQLIAFAQVQGEVDFIGEDIGQLQNRLLAQSGVMAGLEQGTANHALCGDLAMLDWMGDELRLEPLAFSHQVQCVQGVDIVHDFGDASTVPDLDAKFIPWLQIAQVALVGGNLGDGLEILTWQFEAIKDL